jgi:hypothetical protein
MSNAPSRDFDGMSDRAILDLVAKVREAWAPRDSLIARISDLREQRWEVPVPKAWRQTAKTHTQQSVTGNPSAHRRHRYAERPCFHSAQPG